MRLILDTNVVLSALLSPQGAPAQGTYFLGFNAILNWNHLDAGKPEPREAERTGRQ